MMKGKVVMSEKINRIPVEIKGKLPFVKVEINGRMYNFLFDTGAVTCISSELYKQLHLTPKAKRLQIKDSQSNKKDEIVTILPEMKLGSISFQNIGCVVIDFDSFEFRCTDIDGVIGTNHMQHLFWKMNHQEKYLEVATDLAFLDKTGFDIEWDFIPNRQKTPVLPSNFYGQRIGFLFDTGANAYLNMRKGFFDKAKDSIKIPMVTFEGVNMVGIYGEDKNNKEKYLFKPQQLEIAKQSFENELVATSATNLIGNDYLEHFNYILDWKRNKIYLKELEKPSVRLYFPFSPRYKDEKMFVSFILKTKNQPLRLGDVIISVNGQKIADKSQQQICDMLIKNYDSDVISIEILRDNQVLPFTFTREDFFR